jgi:hypothetical protein
VGNTGLIKQREDKYMRIYHGKEKPIIIRGRHCINMANFARRYPGWHTMNAKCRDTRRAVASLACIGCLELSGDQFRWVWP